MALTNAEKQKRYRERVKDRLRNEGPNFPQLLANLYEEVNGDPPEGLEPTNGARVAGYVAEALMRMADSADDTGIGTTLDSGIAILDALAGSSAYAKAVLDWNNRCTDAIQRHRGKKKKDAEPMPAPPPLPSNVTIK